MGFLDKLKLSSDDKSDVPPPIPPSGGTVGQAPPAPPKDLPPLPSSSEPPKLGVDPAPSAPPKLDLSSEPELETDAKIPPAPQKDVSPPTKQSSQPPGIPELKSLDAEPAEENVPPPPAPVSKERSIRSVSDIPPIKLDGSTDKQGIITDRHVQDLDVDKLVLPGEQEVSIIQAPVQKPKEEPHLMKEPEEHPQARPTPTPVPPRPRADSQEMHRAYTGPLYVDVPTYEDVQDHLRTLKQDLSEVTNDVDTISRLNNQETAEFAALVERLERIQDRVLGIDKLLFEER